MLGKVGEGGGRDPNSFILRQSSQVPAPICVYITRQVEDVFPVLN